MFLLKKIAGPMLSPLTLGLELLLLGLVFLWFTRRQRPGKIMVTAGTFFLLLFSYGPIPGLLLRPLERRFPPVSTAKLGESRPVNSPQVKYIVVLGGGSTSDPHVPMASRLSGASLIRLVEGIGLHRELPETKLILSGGGVFDPVPEALAMSQVAAALGVSRQEMVVETDSPDTEAQARIIKKIVGRDKFILVTSAWHLPRTLALFRKQGMEPIPCPVGHLLKESPAAGPGRFFPGVHNLGVADVAVHEYLGLSWGKLRGLL
jgi:uncharacterized SAM-binding protein YcdF (DUF218 family)